VVGNIEGTFYINAIWVIYSEVGEGSFAFAVDRLFLVLVVRCKVFSASGFAVGSYFSFGVKLYIIIADASIFAGANYKGIKDGEWSFFGAWGISKGVNA